ncbi:MAG TPA: FlgO family outer membrane protein [Chthoniobacterales bacterium]|nr:FlgO family outer membrane protein [Chthoniobacterales bacterium]
MNQGNFFAELKRRNVYKVAVAYAIVAWLLIQVATQVFPFFEIPNWTVRLVVLLLILGFPIALFLAWAFEITPEGIKRAEDVSPQESITKHTGRKLIWLTVMLAVIAAGLLAFQLLRPKSATTAAVSTASTTAPATIPEKSIAVLPFENLSDNKENAFFTDGVQDEILTDLAKVADLKVISRTSVMQYKTGTPRNLREIAQQLGVAHLLEGSVQRAGNKVRVNAQLIDARTDAHQWAENFDRDIADVFAIQSEIAKAIADQLQAKLSPSEKTAIEQKPTTDVTAFDLYNRAKNILLTTSFNANVQSLYFQAVDLLNQAIARDPSFFEAYCQLAYANDNLYFLGNDHTPARLALAEAAIQSAFRLRPEAGEAHLARAENLYRGYLDLDGALAELETARRTLPNDSRVSELSGYIVRRQGKHEEAIKNLQRALELDPRNFFILEQIALSYQNLRRYPEMVAMLDRGLTIKPGDVEISTTRASVDLDWKADLGPLRQVLQSLNSDAIKNVADTWFQFAIAERDPVAAERALVALGDNSIGNDAIYLSPEVATAVIARMTKDETKARAAFTAARAKQEKLVQEQPNYGPVLCVLGLIDAGLGRKQEALQEGRRAVELLPVAKDSINGAHMIEYYAMIAAWVGEKDLACEQLAVAVKLPGTLSYGQLKLFPYWDPLRGDPRFEKIVASMAPK